MTAKRDKGAPDYVSEILVLDPENVWGKRPTFGNAELAARLGCLSSYEKQGSFVWYDGFDNGLGAWEYSTPGTGDAVEMSADHQHTGGYCVKLTTSSSGTYDTSIAHKERLFKLGGRFGFEVAFTINEDVTRVEFELMLNDGLGDTHYMIAYDKVNTRLEYTDEDDTWQVFEPDLDLYAWGRTYHKLKLRVNSETKKYLRLFLNHKQWDLSEYSSFYEECGPPTYVMIKVRVFGSNGVNAVAYIDTAILTSEEPLT